VDDLTPERSRIDRGPVVVAGVGHAGSVVVAQLLMPWVLRDARMSDTYWIPSSAGMTGHHGRTKV
ncbi:hypothetical protein OVW20_29180, partial [Klebsiella pneumoniae]|uniref:hypothetical protein n=1 Tax=Klebsiella pneumoniae TaxID=573 RepID=UPI00226D908E